jgi:uncharacterized membrane protein
MNYYWLVLAIIKVLVTLFAVLAQKYYNFKGNFYPIITCIIAAIFFIIYTLLFENINDVKKENFYVLAFFGFLLFIFLFVNFKLIVNSPHPAYFKILSIYELLLLLIISYYFFGAEISLRNWIGFIFIIIGTTLIINYGKK